jgi:hypothetical protein
MVATYIALPKELQNSGCNPLSGRDYYASQIIGMTGNLIAILLCQSCCTCEGKSLEVTIKAQHRPRTCVYGSSSGVKELHTVGTLI